jgi:hypothetical protein
MEIKVNKYQTPVNDELLATLPKEVADQLIDCLTNIDFIQSLISPDRKRAKDLPRDSQGRIIVDIAHPHILEDMDYFRQEALFFEKNNCYTFLKPNGNPNSQFMKWFNEEKRRCWEGYVRPSDGEWVTGFMYWYMNYCPIMLTKKAKGKKNSGNRVEGFPETWEGIYLRFHYIEQARWGGMYNDFEGGNNGAELASRGKSKSFCMASILDHNFVIGENAEAKSNVVSIVTAYQKTYLDSNDGLFNKAVPMADFQAVNTQFPRRRLISSWNNLTWRMGYKDADLGIDKGTQNTMLGISSKDDESKLRGKRAAFVGVEEFGSFPRLLSIYNTMLPCVEDGDIKFGMLYLQGTAGDKDSDFAGAAEIMYHPRGYNMYALPNVYDKRNSGKKEFVFFFPGYLNRKGCYDENGMSDVVKALVHILMKRYTVKYDSSNQNTLLKTVSEVPITPQEAIIKAGVNMFPTGDLTERLQQIDANDSEYDNVNVGTLVIRGNKIIFQPTNDVPIRNFPHKNNKEAGKGAIEFFEMPVVNKMTNEVWENRYIASSDPYDDDQSNTMSLGSTFIFDLFTEQIVAEYTGRPQLAEEYYEITRRMCLFYNARLNYENDKKGLFTYFVSKHSQYLIVDELEFLKARNMIKPGHYGNKAVGTKASASVNALGRTLLRTWLLTPHTEVTIVDNKETEVSVLNLYKLRSRALIQELMLYNDFGNFDRISSMGMLMLLRADRLILYDGKLSEDSEKERMKGYLGDDPFFKTNYDKKFHK